MTVAITQERIQTIVDAVRNSKGGITRGRLGQILQLNPSSITLLVRYCVHNRLIVESDPHTNRKEGEATMLTLALSYGEFNRFEGWGKADRLGLPGDERWMDRWALK